MTGFKRTLIVWFILMGLFLCGVVALNRYGDRMVDTFEARSKIERGLALESARRFDEAVLLYKEGLRIDDDDPELHRLLGRVYTKLGRFADAEVHAARCVELSNGENRRDALLMLARVYNAIGLWDKARQTLNDALHSWPTSAEAHYEMAKVAEALQDYPRMVDELREVAKLGDRDSSKEYVDTLSRRQRKIDALKSRIGARDASGGDYHALGMLYLETGRWDDAIDAFAEAVDSPEVGPDACFWIGVNAEVNGDLDTAVAMYERAVAACPNHLNALLNLRRVRLSRGG